jgi:large subunit ribosomal protein L2
MPIKKSKPTTNGRRNYSVNAFTELSGDKPEKKLLSPIKKTAGRNNSGRITVRHRGGGHKRLYRHVDFKQMDHLGQRGIIKTIEYDPNRTAFISLVQYADGEKRYILAHQGAKVGEEVLVAEKTPVKSGNRMMLKNIPASYTVFNIELRPGKGGQIIRSAGSSAVLVSLDSDMAQVKLPSGEVRFVSKESYATIGAVSNTDHSLVRIGKAGRMRWMGRRPQVLGKSMNPCDHPHGGGEGHSPIGMKSPKTPWGACALGVKTRKKSKWTNKMIVSSRHKKK